MPRFSPYRKYTEDEILEFELKNKLTLPPDYRLFLTVVGASKLFVNRYGLGIEFYLLDNLRKYSDEIFIGMKNPYPILFPVAADIAQGATIAFDMRSGSTQAQIGVFDPEEDPEKWLEENDVRFSFSDWLARLVSSGGISPR